MYDILTNDQNYKHRPWEQEELDPDLVLSWKLPESYKIDKATLKNPEAFLSSPPYHLSKAFALGEHNILNEMVKWK